MLRTTLSLSLFLASPLLAAEPPNRAERPPVVVSERALKLHHDSLLVDGHNDLPWELREKSNSTFEDRNIQYSQKDLHTDIPRLRKGGVGAQFWAAYVPVEYGKKGTAARTTLEQIDLIHRMIQRYPDAFEAASTADDIVRIRKAGKIASLIGVEGGHSIENSLGVLRCYYKLGVRYMTLTHSENTDWADSATDKPIHNGLTPFGEDVVREMNRIGMLVDISHVSPATMKHALRISSAPVIASHSSAFAICQHPRNVPDDVLTLIKENDGVVMVNFFSGFIVPEAARQTLKMFDVARELRQKYPKQDDLRLAMAQWRKEHPYPRGSVHVVVDHIDHIVKIAGVDHVGLGSDFDGIPTVPKQLEDVSCYPFITQELLNRGYSEADVRKILGENLLRVLRRAEAVAARAGK